MCGIAGFAPKPSRPFLDAATLQRMTTLLAHRGPDAETFMIDQGFGLGHRRLSIIDVDGGDNPLEDPDGAVSLVFNGEIYNHLELRAELEAKGARPRTRSDGEVIVHGYLAFGLDGILARLRGMFAFALFDRRDRTLHLARDPFGIKPLYHSITKDALVFGSEIKAITGALPGPWELSRRGLLQSASLGFTLAPETIFERVQSLPPGHAATWRDGRLSLMPYHALAFAPAREPADPDELWHRFRDTVGRHLMSEVPLGAFLSGGVDSAAVVAAMGEISAAPIDAVTVGVNRHPGWTSAFMREPPRQHSTMSGCTRKAPMPRSPNCCRSSPGIWTSPLPTVPPPRPGWFPRRPDAMSPWRFPAMAATRISPATGAPASTSSKRASDGACPKPSAAI